jgi:hypothetical protein
MIGSWKLSRILYKGQSWGLQSSKIFYKLLIDYKYDGCVFDDT